MPTNILNNILQHYGQMYLIYGDARPVSELIGDRERDRLKVRAIFFEHLLLFDRVTIKVQSDAASIITLIEEIGLNRLEELLERKAIDFLIWTPFLLHGGTKQLPDGSDDLAYLLTQDPLLFGYNYFDADTVLNTALSNFRIDRDRRRIFKRVALDRFITTNVDVDEWKAQTIQAYELNRLAELGLANTKPAKHLLMRERSILGKVGDELVETAILAEKGLISYNEYSCIAFLKQSLESVTKGFKISEDTSKILSIHDMPNIQQLIIDEALKFDDIWDLRMSSTAKEYRKWINNMSLQSDSSYITKEYINELTGKNKFFESTEGKFLKAVAMYGIGAELGHALAGLPGAAFADFGLSLFDTFLLDKMIKGWNPKMFIDEIELKRRRQ